MEEIESKQTADIKYTAERDDALSYKNTKNTRSKDYNLFVYMI